MATVFGCIATEFELVPTLTRAIKARHTPESLVALLRTFARFLEENKEWFSETSSFCDVNRDRRSEWETALQNCGPQALITMPQLWTEVCNAYGSIWGSTKEVDLVRGIVPSLNQEEAYVFAVLLDKRFDSTGEYRTWASDLVEAQPVYLNLPSLYPQRHELRRLLNACIDDVNSLVMILSVYSKLGNRLVLWLSANSNSPTEDDLLRYENEAERILSGIIANPLSDYPLAVRRLLATVNIRSLVQYFLDTVLGEWRDIHCETGDMRWKMLHCILATASELLRYNAHSKSQIERAIRRLSTLDIGWGRIAAGYNPMDNWDPFEGQRGWFTDEAFETHEQVAADEDDSDKDDSDEAFGTEVYGQNDDEDSDEDFVPVGKKLNVEDWASLVKTKKGEPCSICLEYLTNRRWGPPMRLDNCHHVFHRGCLRRLINGIQEHSNKCPLCRVEICPARQKRHK